MHWTKKGGIYGSWCQYERNTLHYYRDPLLRVLSEDAETNLRAVVIYGTSDLNETKMHCAERVAATLRAMRVDGAIFSCNAIGNNHIDYAHAIEETEKAGIPVTALALCPGSDFVVQNDHLDGVICCYKTGDRCPVGDETNVLSENTISVLDARKALAFLKLKMRRWAQRGQ